MIFRKLSYKADLQLIKALKDKCTRELNLPGGHQLFEPLPYAHYFACYSKQEEPPIGFSEIFSYMDAYGGYDKSPYAKSFDLKTICPAHKMGHFKTLYIAPEHRKNPYYIGLLCLKTVNHFTKAGIEHCTLSTLQHNKGLVDLYRKLGARQLGSMEIPGFDEPFVLMTISLKRYALTQNVAAKLLGA